MDYLASGLTLAVCLLGAVVVVRSGSRRLERRIEGIEEDLRQRMAPPPDGEVP